MNIYDLNHLEEMNEATNLVGGAGTFDYFIEKSQVSILNQYASSYAEAEAQFGGATAVSTVANLADVTQLIG